MKIKAVYHTDGVYIRITENRKSKYKKLFQLDKTYWDGSGVKNKHERHNNLNKEIADAVKKYHDKAFNLASEPTSSPFQDIMARPKVDKSFSEAIVQYANLVRKEGKFSSYRKYINAADKVSDFKDVSLSSINQLYLRELHEFLKKKNLKPSTIHRYFKFLKTVIRFESNEDPSVNRSILNYKVKNEESIKEKLTREEFELIVSKDLDQKLSLSRDVFCALVYSWGSRIGDMLQMQPKHIKNDRLEFKEQKTGKHKSVKIDIEFQNLINRYKGTSTHYLFPFLVKAPTDPRKDPIYQKEIESKTSIINKDLKLIAAKCNIDKKITTHVARHTFAVWASKKEVPLYLIQEMLNHSSKSVTENYLKQLNKSKNLDQAAAKVFSL